MQSKALQIATESTAICKRFGMTCRQVSSILKESIKETYLSALGDKPFPVSRNNREYHSLQVDEMREAHSKLHRLCTDRQGDTSYWRTAKLYAIQAYSVCTTCDESERECGVDILVNKVAAKKGYPVARRYKSSKRDKRTARKIYRLDAYMIYLINSFGDSVETGRNDPNELEPTEPVSSAYISQCKITKKKKYDSKRYHP